MSIVRVVLTGLATLLAIALVVGAYLGFSMLVLWIGGRLSPLIGRRSRRPRSD